MLLLCPASANSAASFVSIILGVRSCSRWHKNMAVRIKFKKWIALLLSLAGFPAAASSLPERAEYLAEGFRPVFAHTRELFDLVRVCREKLTATCGQELDEDAPGLASLVEAMPFFTVFEATAKNETDEALTEANIWQRMGAARDRLNRELLSFDQDLLQRYRALVAVCPFKKADFLPPDLDTTFPRYWQLSDEAYAEVKRQVEAAAARSAQQIRGWPKSRCIEARQFSAVILVTLEIRLRPFAAEGWQAVTKGKRFDGAVGAVFTLAVAFEETVHPDVMKDIEARMIEFESRNTTRPPQP